MTNTTTGFHKQKIVVAAQHNRAVYFHHVDGPDGFFTMPEGLTLNIGFVKQAIDNGTFEPTMADLDDQQFDDASEAFAAVLAIMNG